MSNRIVKYVGFYDVYKENYKRVSSLAAVNKMNYLISVFNKLGYKIEIISPSWIRDNTIKKEKIHRKYNIEDNVIVFPPSFITKNKLTRGIKIIYSLCWLTFYLLFNTEKKQKIIVYHSPWLYLPLMILKFIKKPHVVLEVEEIYQDVSNIGRIQTKWETKLLNLGDSYIFSNDLMHKKIGKNKNSIVLYGVYEIFPVLTHKYHDGKIHLLYAGILDNIKNGAHNAIEAAKFLSDKYVLHIIGFGQNKASIISEILEHNKIYACKIRFDGAKTGDEFVEYCQRCDIGLSTQTTKGEYVNTSFPSKILTYLGLGLEVVSGNLECVTQSLIANHLVIYHNDDPNDIAKAIMNVPILERVSSNNILYKLEMKLVKDLEEIMEGENE